MSTTKIARPFNEARTVLNETKRHIERHIKSPSRHNYKEYDTSPYSHFVVYVAVNSPESHMNWLHEEHIQHTIDYLSTHPEISDFVVYSVGEQVTLVNKGI